MTGNSIPLSAVTLIGALALGGQAYAASQSFTTGAPVFDDSFFIDEFSSGDSFFSQLVITGLPKFNSSLGTLTGVTLDIDFDYSVDASVEAAGVTDDSLPHSVDISTQFTDFELIYQTPNAGHVLGSSDPSIGAFGCAGGPFEGGCLDGGFDSNNWLQAGMDPTAISSGYDASDFSGTGDVDALELWFVAYQFDVVGDNVDGVFGDMFVSSDPSGPPFTQNFITIHYEYTPTVVPVPAAVWLFGGALGLLAGLSRRLKR